MKTIKRLVCGLVGLSILIWANGVMAQPQTLKMLRIPANGFVPGHPSTTYLKYGFVLSRSSGTGSFYFPISLPSGSVIRQIELNCYENDPVGYLRLRLISASDGTETILLSAQSSHSSSIQNIKSTEISHQIDYSSNYYSLELYFSNQTTAINCFSVVIYYNTPISASYLPLLKRQ